MQKYHAFQPTGFDPKGLELDDQQNWFVVPVMRDRDSLCLAQSNFDVALEILGGESATVEVHRFGHWAHGWFEIIIVHPSRETVAQGIEDSLEDYPILDEMHYSTLQWETAGDYWISMSLEERVAACQESEISVFKARHDTMPRDIEINSILGEE